MKRWTRSAVRAIALLSMLFLATAPGCDTKKEDPVICTPSLTTNMVLVNPLAPAPGDTATLTVQTSGEGCGAWPAYHWQVSGGVLLRDTGISVKWQVPADPGVYEVVCRAALSGNADTAATAVMVRNFEYVNTGRIASIYPQLIFGTLYFVSEFGNVGPRHDDFLGWGIYRLGAPGSSTKLSVTGENAGGGDFYFGSSGTMVWGSFISGYSTFLRSQRINVWRFEAMLGVPLNVSNDISAPVNLRNNQHTTPWSNATSSMAVWKCQEVGTAQDGTRDLFNIAFWNEALGQGGWYKVTQSHDWKTVRIGNEDVVRHRYYNNIKPMFTPDESHILYFVDTTGVFEPCLIPMAGNAPDTTQRRDMTIDAQTGIFKAAGVGSRTATITERTIFQWNPAPGMGRLGFIAGGRVTLFDYASESVAVIEDLVRVEQFAWSPDGTKLAAVTDEGIFLASAAGAVSPHPLFVRERGTDEIIGLVFSPDVSRLGFRLVRKGKAEVDSWSALVIIDLDTGVSTYASPRVAWLNVREPDVPYNWMRIVWEDNDSILAPFTIIDENRFPGKDVVIFRSYGN